MTEYDVGVTLHVVIEADSKKEAKDIEIKNVQNCLDPYYIEVGGVTMKNRDRYILKINEYDMLVKMQANIIDGGCCCVIDALTGGVYPCKNNKMCMLDTCKECIQKWLNEEEEK